MVHGLGGEREPSSGSGRQEETTRKPFRPYDPSSHPGWWAPLSLSFLVVSDSVLTSLHPTSVSAHGGMLAVVYRQISWRLAPLATRIELRGREQLFLAAGEELTLPPFPLLSTRAGSRTFLCQSCPPGPMPPPASPGLRAESRHVGAEAL